MKTAFWITTILGAGTAGYGLYVTMFKYRGAPQTINMQTATDTEKYTFNAQVTDVNKAVKIAMVGGGVTLVGIIGLIATRNK